ncbi:EpsG family protein [Georgenia muralis]
MTPELSTLDAALLGVALVWSALLVLAPAGSAFASRWNAFFPAILLLVYSSVAAIAINRTVPDRQIYIERFEHIASLDLLTFLRQLGKSEWEPAFLVIMRIASAIAVSESVLYGLIGMIVGGVYMYSVKTLTSWPQVPYIFFGTMGLGFYLGYTSVVVRQGLSMAFLLLAIALAVAGHRQRSYIPFLIVASLFHWSAAPATLVAFLLSKYHVSLRTSLVVWGGLGILFLTDTQRLVFQPAVDLFPIFDVYTNSGLHADRYTGGVNRWDFFAFSALILAAGLVLRRCVRTPSWYDSLLVHYVFFNAYFLAFGFIYYSDRLAAYSWFLAPLILFAPLSRPTSGLARLTSVSAIVLAVCVVGFTFGSFDELFLSLA